MATEAGRSLALALAGGLAVIALTGLAFHLAGPGELGTVLVALGGGVAALLAFAAMYLEGGRRRTQDAKVSEELDVFSGRLVRLESRLDAVDGSGSRATLTLTDMAADLHALSQVVRSLAEALTEQEREISALKGPSDRGLSFASSGTGISVREGPPPSPASARDVTPSFLPAWESLAALLPTPSPTISATASHTPGETAILAAASEPGRTVDLHVQPIMSLPQRHERLYELYPLLRISPEELLLPEQYLPTLERLGAAPDFLASMLAKALVFAHRLSALGSEGRVVVAVPPAVLEDGWFLRRLEMLFEDHGAVASRVVLQLEQGSWDEGGSLAATLARLGERGAAFALGRVVDENLNPPALARRRIQYVRLSARRLLDISRDEAARSDLTALALALTRSGVELIADAVEEEADVPEMLDLGMSLAQGLALALPRPADTVLEGSQGGSVRRSEGPVLPPARTVDRPSELDGPLRDFLRRVG